MLAALWEVIATVGFLVIIFAVWVFLWKVTGLDGFFKSE